MFTEKKERAKIDRILYLSITVREKTTKTGYIVRCHHRHHGIGNPNWTGNIPVYTTTIEHDAERYEMNEQFQQQCQHIVIFFFCIMP